MQSCDTVVVWTTADRWLMRVGVVALIRPIAARVAVHAARIADHDSRLLEKSDRARLGVRNAIERGYRAETGTYKSALCGVHRQTHSEDGSSYP